LEQDILAEFADYYSNNSSAGAKAAGLGTFIPMMIQDCYPAEMQLLLLRV
jgi:hypothetical protein